MNALITFWYWLTGLNEAISFFIVLTINTATLAAVYYGGRKILKETIRLTAPKHWKETRK